MSNGVKVKAKPDSDSDLLLNAPVMLCTSASAATLSTRTGSLEARNALLPRVPTKQNTHVIVDDCYLNFKQFDNNRHHRHHSYTQTKM